MDKINIPSISFFSFTSYQNIHKSIIHDTRCLRQEDSNFRRKHRLIRQSNTNTTDNTNTLSRNTTKQKQTKKLSAQKKQILIFEALKNIPNKTYTKSGQLELAKTKTKNN